MIKAMYFTCPGNRIEVDCKNGGKERTSEFTMKGLHQETDEGLIMFSLYCECIKLNNIATRFETIVYHLINKYIGGQS